MKQAVGVPFDTTLCPITQGAPPEQLRVVNFADRYGYSTVTGIYGYISADDGLQMDICNHQAELPSG